MEYTIPKPAYNTPRRRITELRRVPNAIPFARYSTRLHRDCHEARAHSQWTPYANENENGRRLRTSGQMLRLTRIVLPSPPSFPITLLPAFFPSLLPRALFFPLLAHCPSSAQPSTDGDRGTKTERERDQQLRPQ